ncbi:MAG: lysozyme inhibitor LprI family protein [Jaaginema sp. PMC 1079.18]|nr:lysozyme inhibitor LprI family protein [Jaaginema sp. PMC 1080.18]MEC4850710.1 lysozyme inhibitor LprI family protein [Jaaginema sp. PMC 1079.18]MEC4864715.1 lysozyme inhibitor LprI family protein [Jaaginema sp. PMC 1078.18]
MMGKILTTAGAIALLGLVLSCSQSANSSTENVAVSPATPRTEAPESAVSPSPESAIAQSPSTPDCDNATTQMEMNFCAAQDAKDADTALNQVYQQLRGTINNEAQTQRLISAQKAWITFRDADCEYSQRRYDGGSIMPMIYSSCIADRTRQRTQELQMYLEDQQRL